VPDWSLRTIPPALAERYTAEGLWRDLTLGELLAGVARERPRHVIRIWSRTHPFEGDAATVHDAARRIAGFLQSRGIGPGDVVSFQMPNHVEAVVALWAIALTGAVAVPVVHFYGPKELGYILGHAGSRAHLTASRWGHLDYLETVTELARSLPALETIVVSEHGGALPDGIVGWSDAADGEPVDEPADVDPGAPAVVAYTSGTTADPKGVVHSHRTLLAEVAQLSLLQEEGGRPILVGAPVAHAIGMLGGLLNPLWRGVDAHIADGWDPAFVLDVMLEADISAGSGATYFFTSLLDHPDLTDAHLAKMRVIGLGGAPVPAAVGDRARDLGIIVTRSYGCTELPSITGSRPTAPHEERCHTDGRPMPGVEMRVVDAAGADVRVGEPGEIVARGPEMFLGYTDPGLTARAVDADGWYRTGDIGVLDENGALTITDRVPDLIIRAGTNISAAEVEEQLMRLPGVAEVAVVAAPDERFGEHACAFVRAQPGATAPDLTEIRDHLAAVGLARPKWPEEVRVVDDFPRTPSGKIKKFELRDGLRREANAPTGVD
jgi:acyl-CoA synthetase (AMP-forming)/AMP-acid ligase II